MLPMRKFLLLATVVFAARLYGQLNADYVNTDVTSEISDKYLVVLSAERDFDAVKRDAERVSDESGVQFSTRGKIWRYNELDLSTTNPFGYISVEKSQAYAHLQRGYYIALAAICDSPEAANTELVQFSRFAPKAYIAQTEIYRGCIH